MMRSTTARPGFTLIETVVATVIVGVLLVGALGTIGYTATNQLSSYEEQQGWTLAEALFTEVSSLPYMDVENAAADTIGSETGESWSDTEIRDDVDDYDGLSRTLASHPGWTLQVAVDFTSPKDVTVTQAGDGGVKRIRIRVTSEAGRVTDIWGIRCENGIVEALPSSSRTATQATALELQVGADKLARLNANTILLNRIDDVDEEPTTIAKVIDGDGKTVPE